MNGKSCLLGSQSQTVPWAEITSGTQYKYRGGTAYAPSTFPIPQPVTGVVGINKQVSPTKLAGGVATYVITLTNSFTQDVYIDRITDTLPSSVTFGALTAASNITLRQRYHLADLRCDWNHLLAGYSIPQPQCVV